LCRDAPFASLASMTPTVPEQLSSTIEDIYRAESGRILATLVRLIGDMDLAEEAMHEAFAAALESWPQTGVPEKPRPWLISTARFKAIDVIRRRVRFDRSQKDLTLHMEARINEASLDDEEIEDDRLRLPTICGRTSGQRRRAVRWRTASMRQQNMSLPTVRKVLHGDRPRALDRTLSRAFAASRRRTAPLLEHGLADEVLLVVYPVLLGTGKRIFAEGTPPRSFEFVRTKALASGVILSTYKLNGPLRTGTMGG
jgi:DNA-directed RNA polymerase specialized sigma24 family protein